MSAQTAALADFGSPDELAPHYQARLLVAQGRRTALLPALGFPGLVVGWDLVWAAGSRPSGPPPTTVSWLAQAQDVVSLVVGASAVLVLVVLVRGARRASDPRAPVRAVSVVGVAGALLCAGGGAAMTLAAAPSGSGLFRIWSPAGATALVSLAVLGLVLRSAARTLRLTRAPIAPVCAEPGNRSSRRGTVGP